METIPRPIPFWASDNPLCYWFIPEQWNMNKRLLLARHTHGWKSTIISRWRIGNLRYPGYQPLIS